VRTSGTTQTENLLLLFILAPHSWQNTIDGLIGSTFAVSHSGCVVSSALPETFRLSDFWAQIPSNTLIDEIGTLVTHL
jgi:hypothetical protein